MFAVQDLSAVRNQQVIFNHLSFELKSGSALQITGANGSGKSTLLRILAGLMRPSSGVVIWQEQDIADCMDDYHQNISYLGHRIGVKEALTVSEQLAFSRALISKQINNDKEGYLFELDAEQDKVAGQLSRGQKQRLAFCRLGLLNTSLWLLDEPFTAIDQSGKTVLENRMVEHIKKGGGLIFTSHQPVTLPGIHFNMISL